MRRETQGPKKKKKERWFELDAVGPLPSGAGRRHFAPPPLLGFVAGWSALRLIVVTACRLARLPSGRETNLPVWLFFPPARLIQPRGGRPLLAPRLPRRHQIW